MSLVGRGGQGPDREVVVIFSLLDGTVLNSFSATFSPHITYICHSSIHSYIYLTNIFIRLVQK